MAIYAVGDIQGCLKPLHCLLEQVGFNKNTDQLWCAGDLINRGPESLETLRFIRSLEQSATIVLGNHDLHLLAAAMGQGRTKAKDTLDEILSAPDKKQLVDWLLQQKLIHTDENQQWVLVHAGIPPIWTVSQALTYAQEVENVLRSDNTNLFFANMYGNEPAVWNESLTGAERWRIITNYLTRMRFCSHNGELELTCKLGADQAPKGYEAWYKLPNKLQPEQTVLFGHWAAINGETNHPQLIALDTGCVWGRTLTLFRLDDRRRFQCDCSAIS